MGQTLQDSGRQLEALAKDLGLDYFPVHFEEVPDSFMMEIAERMRFACAWKSSKVLAPRSVGKPPPWPSPLKKFSKLKLARRMLFFSRSLNSGVFIRSAVSGCSRRRTWPLPLFPMMPVV